MYKLIFIEALIRVFLLFHSVKEQIQLYKVIVLHTTNNYTAL